MCQSCIDQSRRQFLSLSAAGVAAGALAGAAGVRGWWAGVAMLAVTVLAVNAVIARWLGVDDEEAAGFGDELGPGDWGVAALAAFVLTWAAVYSAAGWR